MSFIGTSEHGLVYAPGWFLKNNEQCTRETRTMIEADSVTSENGGKYIKMGTVFPTNDANAIGIVYEDVDVSTGDMPGSVVTRGEVYEDRLPEELDSAAKTALEKLGFTFSTSPAVTRPEE